MYLPSIGLSWSPFIFIHRQGYHQPPINAGLWSRGRQVFGSPGRAAVLAHPVSRRWRRSRMAGRIVACIVVRTNSKVGVVSGAPYGAPFTNSQFRAKGMRGTGAGVVPLEMAGLSFVGRFHTVFSHYIRTTGTVSVTIACCISLAALILTRYVV